MNLYNGCKEILKIQKFRRIVSYAGFYCFTAVLTYAYTSNTTRAGFSRADQFYASYPAGTELLTDTAKLYKAALGNCFENEEWGPIEYCIMAKHFERQGKDPMLIMPITWHTSYLTDCSMEVGRSRAGCRMMSRTCRTISLRYLKPLVLIVYVNTVQS